MSNINNRILSQPISYQELNSITRLKITGIYKIENTVNHKVYIGQSVNVINRLKDHTKKEDNKHLRNSFEKYGLDKFSFEVIKQTYDLNYWEVFLIQIYHATDDRYGYNNASGGACGDYWNYITNEQKEIVRKKFSENTKKLWQAKEYRIKNSNSHKGNPNHMKGKTFSQEVRQHMSEAHKGHKQTEETKKRISEFNKGKIIPLEQREIISETFKGTHYYTNGQIEVRRKECPEGFVLGRVPKDRHHSEETKELIRIKRAKQVFSQESIDKRRESLIRFNNTPEGKACRKRVGEMNRGKKYSGSNIIIKEK